MYSLSVIFFAFLLTVSAQVRDRQDRNGSAARARALEYLLDNYRTLSSDDYRAFQRVCPRLDQTPGPNAGYCERAYRRYRRVISTATEMLAPLKGTTVEEATVANLLTCLPPREEFTDLSDILASLQQTCSPLTVGESRRFPNPQTPGHSYNLKRVDGNTYEATVVVNFTRTSGDVSPAQMLQRSNECFQALAPYLKTPAGEQLRIRNITPSEAESQMNSFERPPALNITIEEGGDDPAKQVRGHAHAYTDNFKCETIIHETLHHLGLCDEYPESDNSIPRNPDGTRRMDAAGIAVPSMVEWNSCRVVPKTNTIMSAMNTAVMDTIPLSISCQCRAGAAGDGCRAAMTSQDPRNVRARNLLTQPTALRVFQYPTMQKCGPITDSAELGRLRSLTPPEQRLRLIGSDAENFIIVETNLSTSTTGFSPWETFKRCRCQGNEDCRRGFERGRAHLNGSEPISMASCPFEMEPRLPGDPLFRYLGGAGIARPGQSTTFTSEGMNFVSTPVVRSQALLAPNHLPRIIFGGCQTGPASTYNRCAAFSQRARPEVVPEYCAAYPERCCSSRPSECNNDEYFLGLGSQAGGQ